jgi:hypothetical protein
MHPMTTASPTEPPFVPADFVVPAALETADFRLRMLSTADVAKDYAALMESADLLHAIFGRDWPTADFTLEDNLRDLAEHEAEFLQRQAFAYTVASLDETACLGCVYIYPPRGHPTDARVYLWVRQSAYDRGLDPVLFATVKAWIADRWPFASVLYPGRAADGSWQPLNGAAV